MSLYSVVSTPASHSECPMSESQISSPDRFLWFFSASAHKYYDSALQHIKTGSFHVLPNLTFITILPPNTTQHSKSMLLNKPVNSELGLLC
jgi:hypothetical protein